MALMKAKFVGSFGETITQSNTLFDVIFSAGGTMTFTDVWTPRNAQVSIDANGTTTAGYVLGVTKLLSVNKVAFDQPFMLKTLPSTETAMVSFHGDPDNRQFSVVSMTDGSVMVRNGANVNAWRSAAGILVAERPLILSVFFTRNDTTGTFRVVVYEEDGTTIRADSTLKTAQNTGTLPIVTIKHTMAKSSSSSTVVGRYIFGEPRWDVDANALLPAWTPNTPLWEVRNGAWNPIILRTPSGGTWIPLY